MTASTDRVRIGPVECALQLNLRGDPGDPAFMAAVGGVLGVPLPVKANTWAQARQCVALWLGPDEWLLAAADGDAGSLEAALGTALRGLHHSVVDVSASRSVIAVSGADARALLAKGCALDLHAAAFGSGACAQTLLAKAQVILQCVTDEPVFHLYVRNSFAEYLSRWLADAAAETAASQALDAAKLAQRLA